MRRVLAAVLIILSVSAGLCGCAGKAPGVASRPLQTSFFAMDTLMEITVYPGEEVQAGFKTDEDTFHKELTDGAKELIGKAESELSVTDENSDIYRLNSGKPVKYEGMLKSILSKAVLLCGQTGGNLDISIYPLVRLWGFTTDGHSVPEKEQIEQSLRSVGYKALEETLENLEEGEELVLPEGVMIDLGAVAKGYTAQLLKDYYVSKGITKGLLSLGGNVLALGTKPGGSSWRIAIADPFGEGYAGIVSVSDLSVVTSGGYERFFEENGKRYSHIIDPFTGYPVDNGIMSVSVIGADSMYCDALSTALFVMGKEEAVRFWRQNRDFDFVLITGKKEIYVSEGLKERFTADKSYGDDSVFYIE